MLSAIIREALLLLLLVRFQENKMDLSLPNYPYDIEELKSVITLLEKLPLYEEKISSLHKKITALSKKAAKAGSFAYASELDDLICKAFYSDLENRPFNSTESHTISRLKAEIAWHGIIKNRNIPCEICGENRSIDKCHIVPSKLGGLKEDENLLYLCPTHHRLFDRFMLSKAEWATINWQRKSHASQEYAENVTFEAHKKFWDKLAEGENENIGQFGADEIPYYEYVINEIGCLFIPGKPIARTSVYKLVDKNIKEFSKKLLPLLIKHKIFIQFKEGSRNMLLLSSDKFIVSQEIIEEIWRRVA